MGMSGIAESQSTKATPLSMFPISIVGFGRWRTRTYSISFCTLLIIISRDVNCGYESKVEQEHSRLSGESSVMRKVGHVPEPITGAGKGYKYNRKRNVLNTYQYAHHIETTRRIKPRVDQRILPLLSTRIASPHHHLLTARNPRSADRVSGLRISELNGPSKLSPR